MYNLAKFVDWPPGTFENSSQPGLSQPILFCVLGQTRLSLPLEDALAGKVVGKRPLLFRQLTDSQQAGDCKVLFISLPDEKRVRQILDQVKSLHVLTVGESPGFTGQGGIARFFLDSGRVRLEFNLDAADEAKLQVSSKLLSLGKIVRNTGR
jgi:YfiR/HmsC-like